MRKPVARHSVFLCRRGDDNKLLDRCGDTVEPVSALQLLRCRSSAEPEVRPLAPGAGYANFSPPCAGRVTSGLKLTGNFSPFSPLYFSYISRQTSTGRSVEYIDYYFVVIYHFVCVVYHLLKSW